MPGSDQRLLDVWRESVGWLARTLTLEGTWIPESFGSRRLSLGGTGRMGDNRFWLRDGCWERPPAHLGRPGAVNTGAAVSWMRAG